MIEVQKDISVPSLSKGCQQLKNISPNMDKYPKLFERTSVHALNDAVSVTTSRQKSMECFA